MKYKKKGTITKIGKKKKPRASTRKAAKRKRKIDSLPSKIKNVPGGELTYGNRNRRPAPTSLTSRSFIHTPASV